MNLGNACVSGNVSDNVNDSVSLNVLALRQEFDLSFAQAVRTQTDKLENLLALRIAGDPYAIRVADINGLHTDRRIMPLPSPMTELLGVTGFRGQIAPVYDLAALLGYGRAVSARWLILLRSATGEPLCLAFDCFETHFSVSPHDIASSPSDMAQASDSMRQIRPHLFSAVLRNEILHPIIQLSSLLQDLQTRADSYISKRRDLS